MCFSISTFHRIITNNDKAMSTQRRRHSFLKPKLITISLDVLLGKILQRYYFKRLCRIISENVRI